MTLVPDFDSYPIRHTIVSATSAERWIEVVWSDGHVSRFHHIWLRDNCACTSCVHQVTMEQMFELVDLAATPHPAAIGIDDDGALTATWQPDGHVSAFHPGWLRAHCYSDEARAERSIDRVTWSAADFDVPPTFDGSKVLIDDSELLDWLIALRTYGIARLRNVPCTDEAIGHIAGRIGVIRETNFGVLWDVWSEPNPISNANTALPLPPHTDLPTREYQPGLQFLHCVANEAIGGDSILVDGFRIAEVIRDESPEDYALLTTVPWNWANRSKTSDHQFVSPLIVTDAAGAVTEVRAGNWLRAPLDLPFEQVEAAYAAYLRFFRTSYRADLQVRFRLDPGDLMSFDNRRALHARGEFTDVGGKRHLRGCYSERDELHSRIRILQRAQRASELAGVLAAGG